jgi:Spy/CpxP family protein refolding chaperone
LPGSCLSIPLPIVYLRLTALDLENPRLSSPVIAGERIKEISMRKTLIAALFAAAVPTLALAMPEAPRDGHRGPAAMFQELDLSKEQRREVGKLMSEEMKARRDITERYLDKLPASEKDAMKKELTAAREKNQNALRTLLTPEQQKRFDEVRKNREEKRAEMAEFKAWKAERDKKQ